MFWAALLLFARESLHEEFISACIHVCREKELWKNALLNQLPIRKKTNNQNADFLDHMWSCWSTAMAQSPLTDHHYTHTPEPTPLASSRLERAASQGGGIYVLAEEELLQLDGPNPTKTQPSEHAPCLTASATAGSAWELGHKWMPHSSSQMKNNFQATCRQKWPPFLSQQGREGRENHMKNPKKLGQFANLSRCLQQLARAVRTNSLFFLLSTTTISNFLQLIWVLGRRNTSQLPSEDEELHVLSLLKPLSSSMAEKNTAKN